jgi:hypothetical protein
MSHEARRLIAGWTCLDDYDLTGSIVPRTRSTSSRRPANRHRAMSNT